MGMSGELEERDDLRNGPVRVRIDDWSPVTCEWVLTAERPWSVNGEGPAKLIILHPVSEVR